MKILVTGSAGYIGSNLALFLKRNGIEVVGLDSFTPQYSVAIKHGNASNLAEHGIETFDVDLAAENSLASIFSAVDGVVHCAAQPGISDRTTWADYHRNNIVATHRLLDACKVSKSIQRFINISTSSVYGLDATGSEGAEPKPASWYGATKLAAEQEVLATFRGNGFPACSMRLFSVFGERERPEKLFPKLIRAIAHDEEFTLFEGSAEHKRSFTYVGDICDGILAALSNWDKVEGEIFNLGTDQCFTTGEAIATVEKAMGKKAKIKLVPARLGDQKATHANIEKIRSVIGWEPKTDLKEGVSKTVDWYMSEVHGKIDWIS